MATVFLAFGSNIGVRDKNIQNAVKALESRGVTIQKMSSYYETKPVGGPPQGDYLNSVASCATNAEPFALLEIIHTVENELGRVRTVPNAPRPIDIDILLYEKVHLHSPSLTIPHPRMWERDFVRRPLKEIAPEIDEGYAHACC